MGSPLGCLLSFFIAILVFIGVFLLTIIGKVKQIMNTFSPQHKAGKQHTSTQQQTYSQNEQTYSQHSNSSRKSSSHHKIFDDDEGEYVDFEEIK